MSDLATPAQRFLRTAEAGRYCGLSPRTLERMRCVGGGPPFSKLGKVVVYDVRALERWVTSRRRASTSEPLVA